MNLKSKWNIIIRGFAIFIFILIGSQHTQNVYAKRKELYSMDVSINFNQYVKYNRNANVKVFVRSKQANFKGFVQAMPKTQNDKLKCIYKKKVTASNGVESIEFTIPIDGLSKYIHFTLADQNGVEILSQTKKLKIEKDPSVSFLGLLGKRDYSGDLDGKIIRPIVIPYEEIPKNVEGLDSFESILISSDLPDEQPITILKNIREWNWMGRTVIVSGKSDALVQYMGGNVKNKTTINDEQGRVVYNLYQNKRGVLIEWLYGKSIGRLLVENKINAANLLFNLKSHYSDVEEARTNGEKDRRDTGEVNLIRSLECLGKDHIPRPIHYTVLLLIYVVLIGPALFLILKRYKRNLYYYPMIVVVSAGFVGVFMMVGQNTALDKIVMNTITIYDYDEASDKVFEESYFGIVAPSKRNEKFVVRKEANINLKNIQIETGIPLAGLNGKEDFDVVIQKEDSGVSIQIGRPLYMKPYVFKSKSQIKKGENLGFHTNLIFNGESIEGSIENNMGYDLENMMLLSNYHAIPIGELRNGQRIMVPSNQRVLNRKEYNTSHSNLEMEHIRPNVNLEQDKLLQLQKSAAMKYCLKGKCAMYNNETYLVGVIRGADETTTAKDMWTKQDIKMIVYRIRNVQRVHDDKTILTDISKYEQVTAGAIDCNTRTMKAYYAVADYYIPSEMKVDSIWIDKEMNENLNYKGTVSIFNNETQEFEKIYKQNESTRICDLEKKNYITNGNRVRLKYTLSVEEEFVDRNQLPIISALVEVK